MRNWPADRLQKIARRREHLVSRAAAQRAVIAGTFHEWQGPIGIVDRVLGVVRFLRAHPVLSAAAVIAALAFRGGGLVTTVGRGLAVLRLGQSVSAWLARSSD
jgi:hypothetical protein